MANRFTVVVDVPHAESGDTQTHRYESSDAREVGAYILGIAHEQPGKEITVKVTCSRDAE